MYSGRRLMNEGLLELATLVESGGRAGARVVALVGGGGKTSAMFALGRLFARRGLRVLATTTTRILDPETASEREGRLFGKVLILGYPASNEGREILRNAGSPLVLGARRDGEKLCGVDSVSIDAMADLFDVVLVEADGSRGLPIKAPASHEPVVPASSCVVIGVVGLDALGRTMDERVAHRPELFGPLVGCAPGERITAAHVARLAASPMGLFKGAPAKARRIVLLNKADLVAPALSAACRDAVLATERANDVILGANRP
jgi:probable selenium-dependent hydroxylase accessory protein YqeC